jgi:DHA3 family macrolide efflux protein-like MFS transporter
MYGAMGTGSLVGVIAASRPSAPGLQNRMLVGGPLLLGGAMLGFALIPIYWLSLATLFLVGVGSSMFMVNIQQTLQMLVTNEFRGRVMGVWSLVHSSMRPLGELQFSSIAALATAPFSLIVGGVMVIAGATFLGLRRGVPTYQAAGQESSRVEAG